MKRVSPRRRYFASLFSAGAVLLVLGGSLHYYANRAQRVKLASRVSALERDIAALHPSMQNSSAVGDSSAVSNEPRSGESAGGYRQGPVCRPRLLGSGRNRGYAWCEYVFADGYTARYYLRTNSTPAQVRAYVSRLVSDSRAHSFPDDDKDSID